jgi:RHS repeat-associated protein
MNRLVSKIPDASLNEPPVTFTYTTNGQRASMTDASGTTTYTYDSRDRLKTKATPHGTLTYAYDAIGNLVSLRSSNENGVSVDYTYDALNRLATAADNRLPAGANTTTYGYDPNGNLTLIQYPNGVATSYTYNTLNRLTNMSATKGGTSVASYIYTLGAAGNRLSVVEQNGRTVNYSYDSLYRLTEELITNDAATSGTVGYTYDAVGNRLSRASTVPGVAPTTSTYDANDRLNGDAYDANGSTTASATTNYTYDSDGKLTEVNGGQTRYVYDGDGNRVSKTAGGVTVKYLVDSNNRTGHAQVVEELVGASVVRQYTYGHDLVSQRQLIGGVWKQSFYGYDGHGSVRYLTGDDGSVTDTYTYDAFGILVAQTGSTPNDYLYAGEQFDANLGFYYLRARYLNAASGRFQTLDAFEGSIFEPLSLHKYLYAGSDPLNKFDPSGNSFLMEQSFVMGEMGKLQTSSALTAMAIFSAILLMLYQANAISTLTFPALEWHVTQTAAGQKAVARERTKAQDKVETARRTSGCRGNILFHYTDKASAFLIYGSQKLRATRAWTDPTTGNFLERGPYATGIPPWADMTKRELAAIFYFNPATQEARLDAGKLDWFVGLCNDRIPPFVPSPANGQWVLPLPRGEYAPVNAFVTAPNPMP